MKLLTTTFCAAFIIIAATDAVAEETIFDPENPAVSTPEAAEEEAEEGGEETIFDPENPAVSETDEQTTDGEETGPTLDDEDSEPSATSGIEQFQFTGDWSSRLRLDTQWESTEEDIVEVASDFGLELKWDASESMRVVIGGEIRHWMAGKSNPDKTDVLVNAREPRADLDLRLGEAYVLLREGRWSLRAGNLVTRWGATDLSRPGDVVNPVDLTEIDGPRAGERLPQPTVDLVYSGNGWSWQGLLVPFFVADDVWLVGRDSALLNPNNTLVADRFPVASLTSRVLDDSILDEAQPLLASSSVPDETPGNASLGTRVTATFANTDVGLGYFFGWDRQAFFEIDPDLRLLLVEVANDETLLTDLDALSFFGRNADARRAILSITEKAREGATLFQSEHRRLHTVAADVARYVGPIGVRADVAFQPEKTYFTQTFQSVRRPTLSAALGLSWERLRSQDDLFTLIVEGFFTRPFGADEGITEAFVAEAERGTPGDTILIFDDYSAGVAAALVWMIPVIETRLQLGVRSDFTQPDLIVTGQLARDLTDGIELTLGGVVFEGPPVDREFSIGGLYDTNDAVYIGARGLL